MSRARRGKSALRALAEEIRQDEYAARVRDYGEADAATYEARMAEAYRYRAEALGLTEVPDRPPLTDAELERLLGEMERGWAASAGDSPSAGATAQKQATEIDEDAARVAAAPSPQDGYDAILADTARQAQSRPRGRGRGPDR